MREPDRCYNWLQRETRTATLIDQEYCIVVQMESKTVLGSVEREVSCFYSTEFACLLEMGADYIGIFTLNCVPF